MKPLTRRERIEVLLDHWPDFFDVGQRDLILSGEGGVFRLSGMSRHPSVVELARALAELRAFAPNKYAHLAGFYGSPYRTIDRKGRRRVGRKGRTEQTSVRVRERVVPAWVRAQKVRDAVSLLAQPVNGRLEEARPWCFRGEPFLPGPLLESMPRSDGPKVAA